MYFRGSQGNQDVEYDGSGNWIHDNIFADGVLTATYWNNTAQGGTPTNPVPWLSYDFVDWVGTKRVQMNDSAQVELYWTSDPFGNYLTPYGVGIDATEHHFTGQERDWETGNGPTSSGVQETGNDYFNARYYGSVLGRFMSPDPSGLAYAEPANPQSLNLYAYVLNNPLINIDPTGLDCVWLTNDATGVEEVDADSDTSQGDCTASGGYHVEGSLTGYASSDSDGTIDEFYSNDYGSRNNSQNGMPNPSSESGFWGYLLYWLLGRGPDQVLYTGDNPATKELQKTDRVAEVRNQYIDDRCPNTATLNQGSFRAAYDSAMASPPSGTQTEVGGFEGTISTNGDTSTFTINNPSSLSSWNGQSAFGGGHSTDNMYGAGGPGHTVNQKFQWAEVGLCHR
jgi:RHS repeat-associated protein